MDRREATLALSADPDAWQESGLFSEYLDRHNAANPHQPIATRSGTVPLWLNDQYDRDLADWEARARKALLSASSWGEEDDGNG